MMMIRSQDKEKFYPLTHGIYAYGNTLNMDLGGTIDDGKDVLLGEYETESRCLEILDEIQAVATEKTLYHGGVYQMPEK